MWCFIVKKKAYYQKANIVKTYRRTLKKEGMLDQSKLSQKRKFDNGYSKGDKRQRTAKPDRHFKAKKAAEATKEKLAQQESEEKRVEKNIQEKKKQRDLMRKKFSKTTSRGQPIMKHRIENLLTKIIKDA